MMNKRFTKFGSWALVFVLACATPVIPVYPSAGKNKTEKKDKSFDDYWNSFKKSVRKMYRKAKKEYRNHDDVAPYVLGAAALLVGGLLLYKKIIPSWFTCGPSLTDDVLVGKAKCKGHQKAYNGALVTQIKVEDQKGLACGYNAFLNNIHIANELVNGSGDLQAKATSSNYVANFIGDESNPGVWRKIATDIRAEHNKAQLNEAASRGSNGKLDGLEYTDGDDLDAYEVELMIQNEVNARMVLGANVDCDFYVINPQYNAYSQSNYRYGIRCINECKRKLRAAKGRPCLLGLIISLANGYHWIGDVIYKNEKDEITHFVTDSINCVRTKNKVIKKIVRDIGTKEDWGN